MSKRKGPTRKVEWGPWRELQVPAAIEKLNEKQGIKRTRFFANNRYQVFVNYLGESVDDVLHLSIRNRRNTPVRDWRDFQRIKNELCGPEREALELYPAESRLVDTSNQYHLWVTPTDKPIQVGWQFRMVGGKDELDEEVRAFLDGAGVDPDDLPLHKVRQRPPVPREGAIQALP